MATENAALPLEAPIEVCENIGPRGIQMRFRSGVVGFALGVGGALALAWQHAPRAWALCLFAPFALGTFGWLQAREKTCVALAARGVIDLDDQGPHRVKDQPLDAALRRKAASIRIRGALAAALLTAIAIALPR